MRRTIRASRNEGLIRHELTHCEQFYRTCGLHTLLYWLSKRWRYRAELEAWRVQVEVNPGVQDTAIRVLTNAYDLDVSRERVEQDLSQ